MHAPTTTFVAAAPHRISSVRFRAISSSTSRRTPSAYVRNSFGSGPVPKPNPDVPILRMIMFGKPGAGKGTLSSRLTSKYDVSFLSAGDILRQNIADRTEVGRIAEEIVAGGGLLPDDVMTNIITSKLDAPVLQHRAFILDGFPRTVGQGELLDAHLRNKAMPLSLIVNVDVPDDIILSRIADRWVHLPSGRVYNLSYNRPKVDGRDDMTGEPLSKRPDDNPEVFQRRLQAFYKQTSPLLAYYSSRASPTTRLVTLSGKTSDENWPQLESIVQKWFKLRPRPEQTSSSVARQSQPATSSSGISPALLRS